MTTLLPSGDFRGSIEDTFQNSFKPIVLSFDDIPAVETEEEAKKDPWLAALSVVTRGVSYMRGNEVSFAAWKAAESLPSHHQKPIRDLIYATARRTAQRW